MTRQGNLTQGEKLTLLKAGFLPHEIYEFDFAYSRSGPSWLSVNPGQNINFNASNFQDMIKHRIEYVDKLKRLGFSKDQVALRLAMYYQHKASKRSVFDFLQIESSPSQRQKPLSDLTMLRVRTKRERVEQTMGGMYGKKVRPVKLPRNIPKQAEAPPRK